VMQPMADIGQHAVDVEDNARRRRVRRGGVHVTKASEPPDDLVQLNQVLRLSRWL
jgi:hypothetical protein